MPELAPSSQRSVGSATESCPLRQCSLVVQVIRSDTGLGVSGVSVNVDGPTPGQGETEGSLGVKEFLELRAGKYKSEVALAGAAAEKYKKFDLGDRKYFSISRGGEKTIIFRIHPPGVLQVKVLRKDTGEAMKGVTVQFTGPEVLPDKQTSQVGSVVLDPVVVGNYKVKVRLSDELAGQFDTPTSQSVTLQSGETQRLIFELERILKELVLDLDIEPKQPVTTEVFEVALEVDDPDSSVDDPVELILEIDDPESFSEEPLEVLLEFDDAEDSADDPIEMDLEVDDVDDEEPEPVELELVIDEP